jgi:hypothetical protein
MTSVRWIENTIRRIERFEVAILHPDGRDVRSDREELPGYPFERAMSDGKTVQDWKRQRFYPTYPGFDVEVRYANSDDAHGGTLLQTIRQTYE